MADRAALLAEPDETLLYEASRMRAFALAARGHADDALDTLNDGWTDTCPEPAAYVADVARVRLLARDYEDAVAALEFAFRGADRLGQDVSELLAACVLGDPRLRRRALRLAVAGGSVRERGRTAWSVLTA